MAQIPTDTPTPRSYSQILGDMIDTFLSRFGLRALKVGSPVLSMLESAAQSDLRSSEDVFEMLESASLKQATGDALDRIGADENLPRFTQFPASGPVTITDTSFAKVSSKVFQGTAAPIVGSTRLNVTDASQFPASGSIYVGRGTSNYEGPLAYTSVLPPGAGLGFSGGSYWALVLAAGTQRFHNLGETVILAQGGNRVVNAGTVVQTPQGATLNAIRFRTLYAAVLPDGENVLEGVLVVALKPGTTGNVIAGGISSFAAPPFSGASVTNPAPFANGLPAEQNDAYRERIRRARASRARGTALAVQTAAVGVVAPDENKRVLSASVVSRQGAPTVLCIDDGTGYEESAAGVAIESFVDEALGGENYFRIASTPPVTKAYLLTKDTAPYVLASGMQLAFSVGGVTSVHTFDADEFRAVGAATAHEVVASINANPLLGWSARTADAGTRVAVFAKADTGEAIQNVAVPGPEVDANPFLGFPTTVAETMRLYRNDRPLTKDGAIASVGSQPFAAWGGLSSPEDLQLEVDGAPLSNLSGGTFTFTDADFVAAGTGFGTLGRNTPAAWAAVLNRRVPGITATVVNGRVVLTSNRGASAQASLWVKGGSLVTKGVFAPMAAPVRGAASDYTLDRNTGELRLASPLVAGDRLAAGTVNTRAFLEAPPWSTVAVAAAGHMWFAVDGGAALVQHGVTTSTNLTFSATVGDGGSDVRARCTSGSPGVFANVEVGDWVIFWDPGIDPSLLDRSFRVAAVDPSAGTWFEFDASAFAGFGPVTLANAGITFARTDAQLQEVTVPVAASYTAAGLAPVLDAALVGAQASVYRTRALRVNTTSFGMPGGDVALVAADPSAQVFGLPVGGAVANAVSHLASIESGRSEVGTPDFRQSAVSSASGPGAPSFLQAGDFTSDFNPDAGSLLVGTRPQADGTTLLLTRYGNTNGFVTPVESVTYNVFTTAFDVTLKKDPPEWLKHDYAYFAAAYALGPDDELAVLVDGDAETKRFLVPMWRTLKTVGNVYGSTNTFKDADNGGASLAVGFGFSGNSFDFQDFAVFMPARAKTNDQGTFSSEFGGLLPDLNKCVLWRYYRLGEDGQWARIRYVLPSAPNAAVGVQVDNLTDGKYTDVSVSLASGALRTGYSLPDTYPVATVAPTSPASGLTDVYYLLGYKVIGFKRTANVEYYQLRLPAGVTSAGLDLTGAKTYYLSSTVADPVSQNVTFANQGSSNANYGGAWAHPGPPGVFDVVSRPLGAADVAEEDNIGSLYFQGLPPLLIPPTFAGAGIAQGDFMYVDPSAGLPAAFKGYPVRIANDIVADPLTVHAVVDGFSLAPFTTPTFSTLGNAALLSIYANPAQAASAVVAAVNALGSTGKVPVTGTLIGDGSRLLDRSSAEDLVAGGAGAYVRLTDGLNYVGVVTDPATVADDYQFAFKNQVSASLVTNSDWANETVKIVPRTAKNVVDWLNQPAVSGLFSAAGVERSGRGHHVQIASLTPGTAGSVEVQGGSASRVTAAVVGSAQLAGTFSVVSIAAGELPGVLADAWVSVDNAAKMPKNVFGPGSTLGGVVNSGPNSVLTFSAGASTFTDAGSSAHVIAAVEKRGDFWFLRDTGLGGAFTLGTAQEGDWVRLYAPGTPYTYVGAGGFEAVAPVNPGNTGIFRVVRVVTDPVAGNGGVFFENPSGVEQAQAEVNVQFLAYDSILPGDTLRVSTPAWDGSTSNQGVWTVVDVGNAGSGSYLDAGKLTVAGTMSPRGAAAALGASAPLVQLLEGTPGRLIKRVISVTPNQTNPALADLKFATFPGYAHVSAAAGSVLTFLDKLRFPLGVAVGGDGYQHSVGLIGEVQRVIYGDPADPATYPGVVAAGADISIQGPLVRRVQVTLSVRVRSGAALQDIGDRVKSAVAGVINAAGVGESIALSDLVDAARKVGGVVSVTMVNPQAVVGSDLIAVQPYEKPLVLNVDQDILVSFVGI